MITPPSDQYHQYIHTEPSQQATDKLYATPQSPDSRGCTTVEAYQPSPRETQQELPPSSYTTGWLVALSGPLKGHSFPLTLGSNHIGKSRKNHICIAGDPGISSQALIITYDNMHRAFLAQMGNHAKQIAYIDKTPLLTSTKIERNTIIQLSPDIGDAEGTKLLFIPLCSGQFHWN